MRLSERLRSVNILFLLKTGAGSAIAILIANAFGLLYSPSAGIITLLTIQNTKRETLSIAVKRMEAFVLAVLLSYLIFQSMGYTPYAFGLFVALFAAFCFLLGLKDGISMNAVLMTHFLVEGHMGLGLIVNEIGILVIGMGIGILLNLMMPRNIHRIRREQMGLEEEMKKALRGIGGFLKGQEKSPDFTELERLAQRLLETAYEEAGNHLLSDTRYFVSYLEMRRLQIGVLKDIASTIAQMGTLPVQAEKVAGFLEDTALSFHEKNNVTGLLAILEQLKEYFRNDRLPQTREEFEARAHLYQVMKELEYFLMLKRNFVLELENGDRRDYWI
ncbi:uncharacterized membrane protein YgaE (UPF0421/DUF939 family) [Anaerotaenia torta]|uniref:aromatic acid exporter family protein n=1 Tax=Anaerotaenia torta TaxID=433293 RepID=UPI003D218FCA